MAAPIDERAQFIQQPYGMTPSSMLRSMVATQSGLINDTLAKRQRDAQMQEMESSRNQVGELEGLIRQFEQNEIDQPTFDRLRSDLHRTSPDSFQKMGEALGSSVLAGKYAITQHFGNKNPKLYSHAGNRHNGLDLATPLGTEVFSPVSGTVEVGYDKAWGKYVAIRGEDGLLYQMSHLSDQQPFQAGQQIKTGQLLGLTGSTGNSTGPHLDVSVRQNGKYINPLSIESLRRALNY